MSDWTCRCSAKNAEGSRYCEGCGLENPRAARPSVRSEHQGSAGSVPEGYRPASEILGYLSTPKPLSDEQGLAAARIYRKVATGEMRWEQARAALEELFGDEVVRRAVAGESGDVQTSAAGAASRPSGLKAD